MDIMTDIAILVLAAFVGFEVISKVPNTLHTPLMSGTNAIHGIVLLGALLILSSSHGALNKILSLTPEERARGVVAASAGNHAQGVALAAALNKTKATIVIG